jgi:hypothetical protein
MAEKLLTLPTALKVIFKSAEQRYLGLVQTVPDIIDNIPLYHISSYPVLQALS